MLFPFTICVSPLKYSRKAFASRIHLQWDNALFNHVVNRRMKCTCLFIVVRNVGQTLNKTVRASEGSVWRNQLPVKVLHKKKIKKIQKNIYNRLKNTLMEESDVRQVVKAIFLSFTAALNRFLCFTLSLPWSCIVRYEK